MKRIKIPLLFLLVFITAVLLHNSFFGLFGIEEPVFFTLASLSALGFVASVIYLIVRSIAWQKRFK